MVHRESLRITLRWDGFNVKIDKSGNVEYFGLDFQLPDTNIKVAAAEARARGLGEHHRLFGQRDFHVIISERVSGGVLYVAFAAKPFGGRYKAGGSCGDFGVARDTMRLVSANRPSVPLARPGETARITAQQAGERAAAYYRRIPMAGQLTVRPQAEPKWDVPGGLHWDNEYTPEQRACVLLRTMVLLYEVVVHDDRYFVPELGRSPLWWVVLVDAEEGNVMSMFPAGPLGEQRRGGPGGAVAPRARAAQGARGTVQPGGLVPPR